MGEWCVTKITPTRFFILVKIPKGNLWHIHIKPLIYMGFFDNLLCPLQDNSFRRKNQR